MARICRAFPGLFTFQALAETDFRDYEFWSWEAKRAEILERQEMITAARMAMVSDEAFSREIHILGWQLKLHDLEGER